MRAQCKGPGESKNKKTKTEKKQRALQPMDGKQQEVSYIDKVLWYPRLACRILIRA